MLTLQMIRIMNKIWVQEGLDMRMVIFRCFSTGRGRGQLGVGVGGTPLLAAVCSLPSMSSGENEKNEIILLEVAEWPEKKEGRREKVCRKQNRL
jgi:hypothetical protein